MHTVQTSFDVINHESLMVAGHKKYAKAVRKYLANIKRCCLLAGPQIATDAACVFALCQLLLLVIAGWQAGLFAGHYGVPHTCHERNKITYKKWKGASERASQWRGL